VCGILAGLFAIVVGGLGAAFEANDSGLILGLGLGACLLGAAGIVGGALAPRYPVISAILQAGIGVMGFLAVSLFWVLSGILLLIGALLAILGHVLDAG
jgi:hypothetical protein